MEVLKLEVTSKQEWKEKRVHINEAKSFFISKKRGLCVPQALQTTKKRKVTRTKKALVYGVGGGPFTSPPMPPPMSLNSSSMLAERESAAGASARGVGAGRAETDAVSGAEGAWADGGA